MNKVFEEDIRNIISDPLIPWKKFDGKRIVITGATGLIGTALVHTFLAASERLETGVELVIPARSIDKAKALFGESKQLSYVFWDTSQKPEFDGDADYIIHLAGITKSKMMVESPVETIAVSIDGTRQMLELAREKGSAGMLYVSSMEMYGTLGEGVIADETKCGFIDPLAIRSDYPQSKRMCENLCVAYCQEYGVNTVIARMAQTFGAGIPKEENRAFAQFANSSIDGKDIVLHTRGLSEVNFCYTADAVRAMLLLLLEGKRGEAYNVANESAHTTISGMAELIAREVSDNPIRVVYDIPEGNLYGYASDVKLKLSAQKLMALGWTPRVDLKNAFIRLIESMKQDREND